MEIRDFLGQWIGGFEGTNTGTATLDLELDRMGRAIGSLCAFDRNPGNPHIYVDLHGDIDAGELVVSGNPWPVDRGQPMLSSPENWPDNTLPRNFHAKLTREADKLVGRWESDAGTHGTAKFIASSADRPSNITADPEVEDWDSFQKAVLEDCKEPYRYIFRGQSKPWRLRTSFHRTGRKDITRYWREDIVRLRQAMAGRTSQVFDPNNPDHNGSFLYLLQHHSYPTPLLDWTYSPFIAAYFAFSGVSPEDKENGDRKVRILMFDAARWRRLANQLLHVTFCPPHFSLLDPMALGNERATPQQSLVAITNVDDIEAYLAFAQPVDQPSLIRAFDLPAGQRDEVMHALRLMGITPGTLFPGLDGICKEYRDRHFY